MCVTRKKKEDQLVPVPKGFNRSRKLTISKRKTPQVKYSFASNTTNTQKLNNFNYYSFLIFSFLFFSFLFFSGVNGFVFRLLPPRPLGPTNQSRIPTTTALGLRPFTAATTDPHGVAPQNELKLDMMRLKTVMEQIIAGNTDKTPPGHGLVGLGDVFVVVVVGTNDPQGAIQAGIP